MRTESAVATTYCRNMDRTRLTERVITVRFQNYPTSNITAFFTINRLFHFEPAYTMDDNNSSSDPQLKKLAMNEYELQLCDRYSYSNYVARLKPGHINTRKEIFELERATRGQNQNALWGVLRLNRKTASNLSGCSNFVSDNNEAIRYGINQEKVVKNNQLLMRAIKEKIEEKLDCVVTQTVLDCGMFISPIGLFSASPDAYFVDEKGQIVVLEIKCPYTYRNTNLCSIRNSFNNRARYRIPNTAFSINKQGPIDVRVEKKNDHYRQIQNQMYVTGAVLGVYLVKIGETEEVHFVERDEEMIKDFAKNEDSELKRVLSENAKHREFVMERNRLFSFYNSPNIKNDIVKKLARDGFYYWNGCIKCHFCQKHVELENGLDNILAQHVCNSKHGNVRYADIKHRNYLTLQSRINSFSRLNIDSTLAQELAKLNVFVGDDNNLKYYCCSTVISDDKIDQQCIKDVVKNCAHSDDCDRY
ncbi:alk-exo [Trichoplusia ni granulovirus LBIV-12]|jgi:hypothetical protein|uniref:Alk-exo n=2 Tax=Betabaculovirus TaxID=558017 RepID=A0A1D8QLG3_GVTN|nr:alkaline exonuclease [Pseudalatia unipuncta granulovirus]YP_009506212.1 alk-exo [Trichoplusia ni granulovirus LBIV-12]ACH69502.1 alkaline exonuclease [Pseudalatia unipuncta granulovirus]AOW41480.1 alk-exo [Trichoplusia ni granulovirus LBIV-12]